MGILDFFDSQSTREYKAREKALAEIAASPTLQLLKAVLNPQGYESVGIAEEALKHDIDPYLTHPLIAGGKTCIMDAILHCPTQPPCRQSPLLMAWHGILGKYPHLITPDFVWQALNTCYDKSFISALRYWIVRHRLDVNTMMLQPRMRIHVMTSLNPGMARAWFGDTQANWPCVVTPSAPMEQWFNEAKPHVMDSGLDKGMIKASCANLDYLKDLYQQLNTPEGRYAQDIYFKHVRDELGGKDPDDLYLQFVRGLAQQGTNVGVTG